MAINDNVLVQRKFYLQSERTDSSTIVLKQYINTLENQMKPDINLIVNNIDPDKMASEIVNSVDPDKMASDENPHCFSIQHVSS